MKDKDFNDIYDALENVSLLETIQQKEDRLKLVKREIRKLEISVIIIGLIVLGLIALPFFTSVSLGLIIALSILGVGMIVKAFRDGETFETEKFFLQLSINNQKKKEDGK
jgi:hypothetical protein